MVSDRQVRLLRKKRMENKTLEADGARVAARAAALGDEGAAHVADAAGPVRGGVVDGDSSRCWWRTRRASSIHGAA